jgi:putative ABC transport system permease protein
MSTTNTVEAPVRRDAKSSGMPLVLRFALREMRAGLRGFYVFVACVALGVAVITGVGALGDALKSGFESQGQSILGGDVTFARAHKRAEPAERAWIDARGKTSETATMRTMARTLDGEDQALAELKGVDAAYPLVGAVKLSGGLSLDAAVRGPTSAALDPVLMERLKLKIGDKITLGTLPVTVAATIEVEPDTISDRLTFGPRIFVSHETLEKTGLVQPGSLVRWRYALKLANPSATSETGLIKFRDAIKTDLPEAGFIVADRRDPSPQVTRTLERLRQFLTLIGLTALLVGGVGVANAVTTFIDRRRKVIATFKSLGAPSGQVFAIFLTQVMLIAAIGVAIGIAVGFTVPWVLNSLFGSALPIRAELTFKPWSLLTAAIYGFLVALVFTLWPLGRAELVRPGVLFRDEVAPESNRPRPAIMAATAAAAIALVLFAVFTSDARKIALYFCGGLVLVFGVFIGLGWLVTRTAARMKRSRYPELALAIGNLGAPGGLTQSVILSLGAGLSLLVAVALTDTSIVTELSGRLPTNSPTYFVLDVSKTDMPRFRELVLRESPTARVDDAPMLRGRLVKLGNELVENIKAPPEAQWVLNGDRGLSYSEDVPEGSKVVDGKWWPKDYAGEPQVSFEKDLAKRLKVGIGDTVTVNVLGRNVTARITNLREVKWESLAINFVMVFSPNTLKSAPHNLLATITLPVDASLETDVKISRAIGRELPAATAIRVKDAINSFNTVFAKIMTAVRVAGGVTLLAGALVLAGALATAQRRRIKQAVILKTLGATRRRILTSHAIEYGVLASVTALFAIALGAFSAWVALTKVMDVQFTFSIAAVAQALGLALGLVMLFGGLGTWAVLRAPAVPYLRAE